MIATLFIFLLRLELVFAYTTDGANPIIGDILKGCSWLDATIGISYCWGYPLKNNKKVIVIIEFLL